MKRDSRLSGILHVLLHMAEFKEPATSEALAKIMQTNPVVVRRLMAGLREQGFVTSEKGHGGGWMLCCDLNAVTLRDIYKAVGEPTLLAVGNRNESPDCLVEQAVNAVLGATYEEAETIVDARLEAVSLKALSNQFHQRYLAHQSQREGCVAADAPSASHSVSESASAAVLAAFSDPNHVARYTEGPPRYVPGLESVHKMAGVLLNETMPDDGRLLILGAGGGLEMRAFADAFPGWSFHGVDPASEMLKLAARTLGLHAPRAALQEGYIYDAPDGPFDGATCFLTLHFLNSDERLRTVEAVRRRLKPGAPFVVVHSSYPQRDGERQRWLGRYADYAIAMGADPEQVGKYRENAAASLSLFSPETDEAILRDAGFRNVELFYAAFTWRGWIATA